MTCDPDERHKLTGWRQRRSLRPLIESVAPDQAKSPAVALVRRPCASRSRWHRDRRASAHRQKRNRPTTPLRTRICHGRWSQEHPPRAPFAGGGWLSSSREPTAGETRLRRRSSKAVEGRAAGGTRGRPVRASRGDITGVDDIARLGQGHVVAVGAAACSPSPGWRPRLVSVLAACRDELRSRRRGSSGVGGRARRRSARLPRGRGAPLSA